MLKFEELPDRCCFEGGNVALPHTETGGQLCLCHPFPCAQGAQPLTKMCKVLLHKFLHLLLDNIPDKDYTELKYPYQSWEG